MRLTRRQFFFGVAAAPYLSASHPAGTRLDAISGPHLPHTLVIPALSAETSGFFELREYQSASASRLDQLHQKCIARIFPRCGIRPLLWERGDSLNYLFHFESLAARAGAWTAFASDPAWSHLLNEGDPIRPARVSVYVAQRHALPLS